MYKISKKVIDNDTFTVIDITQKNIEVSLTDFGATVLDIKTKNKDGVMESVVLSYKELSSYVDGQMYLNCIVGPIAGRIKGATFDIDDSPYHIDNNFLETESLHSGKDCLGYKFFDYEILEEDTQTLVVFRYYSRESGSNFPGNQNLQVIYTVRDSEVKLEFTGNTTEPTVMNLTSHLYFNLSGNIQRQVLDNELWVNASKQIALDEKFVPVQVTSLLDTHLDFTKPRVLKDVFTEEIYKRPELGIDNPVLLDEVDYTKPSAILRDPISKRKLEVFTTYPSIVIYTHNHPDQEELSYNRKHERHLGICFETQNPPNGVNIDGCEDSILRENEEYYHKTLYKFSIEE